MVLVDDSVDVQNAFEVLAQLNDFPLITASNGVEALEKLVALDADPAVVFVDLTMPIMDGIDFLKRVHEQGLCLSSQIVVLSASEKEMTQESERHHEWLAKPFNLKDVMNIIIKARQ